MSSELIGLDAKYKLNIRKFKVLLFNKYCVYIGRFTGLHYIFITSPQSITVTDGVFVVFNYLLSTVCINSI